MTKTDKLIFWGVLSFSLLLLLFSNILFSRGGEKKAVIEVNGKVYASYRMQELKETKTLTIKTEYGNHIVKIGDKSICVEESDCKNQACLGEIREKGEMLVCLPGRLVLKIVGEQEVDGVAY